MLEELERLRAQGKVSEPIYKQFRVNRQFRVNIDKGKAEDATASGGVRSENRPELSGRNEEHARRVRPEELAKVDAEPKTQDQPQPETLEPGKTGEVQVSDLSLDPKRFQYKMNTDAGGVTDLLKGKKWNADLAGVISTWRDPADGKPTSTGIIASA